MNSHFNAICIDNKDCEKELTLGEKYNMFYSNIYGNEYVQVFNDNKNRICYGAFRFEIKRETV